MLWCIAAAAAAGLVSLEASAHVTLESDQAIAGSLHKAVLRVSHGCGGAATVKVRVRIPDGVEAVKPQLKPGWKVATIKERLNRPPDDSHGGQVTEAIREVAWSGGRLPDDQHGEFAMQLKLPDAPNTTLYFPVVQECAKGVDRWIEIPEAGKSSRDYKRPAPALRLRPKT